MAEHGEDTRTRLIETIRVQRTCIDSYVREKTPASTRLSTISIVSSALAAALTALPALGGAPFAETVRTGWDLEQSQSVWRLMCLGAFAVSVTAAISANLVKSRDLASRIAAAEAAGAMLHGLETRLEFGRLAVKEAAQEYRDVVAGIPFVPDAEQAPPPGHPAPRRRTATAWGRLGAMSPLGASVAVLATLLLVAVLVGYGIGLAGPSVADGGGTSTPAATPTAGPSGPSGPVPTPSLSPAAAHGVYAGRAEQGPVIVTMAVVISEERVQAYLCDGDELEAWLEGRVDGDRLELTSPSGATLTGSIVDGTITGQFARPGLSIDFSAADSAPPAGVYEAWIRENGQEIRFGWAVLADGTQVGIENDRGDRSGAPRLDTDALTYEWEGTTRTAVRVG